MPCLALLCCAVLSAQPRAIVVDGSGPWRDAQWAFTVTQFSGVLIDAGYSAQTVSPVDLPSALTSHDILLAVPSLESLPLATFTAIAAHVAGGGAMMASGGVPFRDPLYLTPGGQWLDSAAYLQTVGSPPPRNSFTAPPIPTVSPSKEQYTAANGLRVPIARPRGIFSTSMSTGRYRVIGDLLTPAATLYFNSFSFPTGGAFIVWLPWPQLYDPLRAQLVDALKAAPNHLAFYTAGADQITWLPGETITGGATIVNSGSSPAQASMQWSVSGPSGLTAQPAVALSLVAGQALQIPLHLTGLANGDYTLHFRLLIGSQEVDRVDSPVRLLDPTLSRQPDRKIKVVGGSFSAGGQHVFLHGVNYWPRYIAGIDPGSYNGQSWLEAAQYDPDVVEADLTEIAALHFNLVNIQYSDYEGFWAQEGRALIDFLERCRAHGIWVQIALRATLTNSAYAGQLSPTLESYLQSAYLPGNDRVFAYELLWEPMVGTHDQGGQGRLVNGAILYNVGRLVLDPDWRTWVNDQYGSLDNAQNAWAFTAPVDGTGQLTNPLDDQMQNDGPWRVMVAAYRRFLEDYLGRNLGLMARLIRRTDPDTLLTYRNWTTMNAPHNANTGYDIGTAAAHLDFFSPERYSPVLLWPDDRAYGLVTAYSRYRTGGKPVHWAEFGAEVGSNGGTAASLSTQAAVCDTMMRQVADDGSNGASVWWWPGGYGPMDGADFGIIDPSGTPRACATTLAQWGTTLAAAAPDLTADPPTTITVDRDADARGSYGLFLNSQDSYVQARQAGMSVVLADRGTGTDTSTIPLIQVGNPPYSGTGPLKFANSELAGIHVVCPTLDVTVENGSTVALPSGVACQLNPMMVNTGEARWLAGSASKGSVVLHTNAGDIALASPVSSLQRTAMGPLSVTLGQSAVTLSGRLRVVGVGDFGEVLNLILTVDSNASDTCSISLSSTGPISAPSTGATGTINITTPAGCSWAALSNSPWLTLNSASGFGNAAVSYSIQPNYGPTRQTTVEIAGHPFAVTEDGVARPPSAQSPTLSAASLTFGTQTVGIIGAPQAVRLTNTGMVGLNLGATAIGGANGGDFSQTNDCGSTLASTASCTVQVTFTPSTAGFRTASLFVAGNIATGGSTVTLSGSGAATGPTPAILAIADSWGYTAGVAPGLWVTIGGVNLGGPPQTWDLDGVQHLPTDVGGVSVTFNGAPAALLYVSGPQINALVPASVSPGPVQVVAQVNGVSSSPFTMTAKAALPAVYALPNADGSTFFVTAALQGTATLVGNSSVDSRVVRAVYSGDTLDLYMIGLGATLDPAQFITDRAIAGAFPVSAPVTASVGGKSANVLFAGLTTPGLYLVRIVVPTDLAAGPQALQVSVGGILTRASLVLQMAAGPPNGR
ncbi:MAG: choice-of-anchor D domain-containing protein [Ignavibacteriota bacterium]